jgi:hypothetical protein
MQSDSEAHSLYQVCTGDSFTRSEGDCSFPSVNEVKNVLRFSLTSVCCHVLVLTHWQLDFALPQVYM